MGANLSSSFADPNVYSLVGSLCLQPSPPPPRIKPGLGDLPESCVALVLEYLNPSEICRLAKLNRAFRGASWADFVWESKLPVNYEDLIERVFGDGLEDKLCKREVYTRLCRANTFDDGTKKAWLDKRTGGVCLSIASKGLAITGIDDRRYWNHIPTEESRLAGQVQVDPSIFLPNFFEELCLINYELGGYMIGPSRASTQLHIFSKSGGLRLMVNLNSHFQRGPIACSSDYNWGGLLRGSVAASVTLSMSMVGI
ncbi:F-box protein PP2-A12 isoform X2 [Populus trichocarpa]|uniref:F-box protein PP2-A12 isoform X2 n=1 Tax=Populus trichocarpa TaxID=3694 RepID=UPI002279ABF5|nr:F-box protein PP2-A12 isoform X2 [Populus trichocarpa]